MLRFAVVELLVAGSLVLALGLPRAGGPQGVGEGGAGVPQAHRG